MGFLSIYRRGPVAVTEREDREANEKAFTEAYDTKIAEVVERLKLAVEAHWAPYKTLVAKIEERRAEIRTRFIGGEVNLINDLDLMMEESNRLYEEISEAMVAAVYAEMVPVQKWAEQQPGRTAHRKWVNDWQSSSPWWREIKLHLVLNHRPRQKYRDHKAQQIEAIRGVGERVSNAVRWS